jgi:hypothetical protein
MSVKQLEWHDYDDGWWTAEAGLLRLGYEVRVTSRGLIRIRLPGEDWDYFEVGGTSDAMAVCQRDFERRVLSALVTPTAQEGD